jgi:hypothetical protein
MMTACAIAMVLLPGRLQARGAEVLDADLTTVQTLHAMALKNLLACRAQLCAILLQALLNRCIVT